MGMAENLLGKALESKGEKDKDNVKDSVLSGLKGMNIFKRAQVVDEIPEPTEPLVFDQDEVLKLAKESRNKATKERAANYLLRDNLDKVNRVQGAPGLQATVYNQLKAKISEKVVANIDEQL